MRVLRLLHALRESKGLPNPGAQFVDRLLVIVVPGWRLSREPGRSPFDIVASTLDLIGERLHVRREAAGHEHRQRRSSWWPHTAQPCRDKSLNSSGFACTARSLDSTWGYSVP